MKRYYVYIITNRKNTILYTGMTNDIFRRTVEHKEHWGSEFTKKYGLDKLVYFEEYQSPEEAIRREKQIKGGSRAGKEKLIIAGNPEWKDLFIEYNSQM